MKTYNDLWDIMTIVNDLQVRHVDSTEHVFCLAAVCMKCGQVVYECQPEWAERQCPCDAPSFDKVWNAYEELVKERQL